MGPVRLRCLLVGLSVLALIWIRTKHHRAGLWGQSERAAPSDLQQLHSRLLVAQELGRQLGQNLSVLLERLDGPRPPTEPPRGGVQPSLALHLPHLRGRPDSLVPRTAEGRGRRGVTLVLGVPTVRRDGQSYLLHTLNSLLYGLSAAQRHDLLIIVFIAEVDVDYVSSVAQTIRSTFSGEVESGLLEIISPPEEFYPDLSNLTLTLDDPQDRVRWRTKQILDFSFLMTYSQDRGDYYVQLEDDVEARADYYQLMKTFVTEKESTDWFYLEFSQLGFIGKLFRSRELPVLVDFFLMFHRDKPVDWLLDLLLWVKVCHPQKGVAECERQKARLRPRFSPSLFQHVGLHSSLSGKIQMLKDKDFGPQVLFRPHSNPAAELETSLRHHQGHSLERAYGGQDFFWALAPQEGDYVLITFPRPLNVSGFLFVSGNMNRKMDKLYNTTVEVLPSTVSTEHRGSDSFRVVGSFEDGLAAGQVDRGLRPVWAVRLVVHSRSDLWALLSEIHIKV